MVPNGWRTGKIGELIKRLDAGVSVNADERRVTEGEIGVLKVSAVSYGAFRPEENKAVVAAEEMSRLVVSPKKDRILISRANTPELVGASVYIDRDYPALFLSDKLWQAEPVDETLSMRWLNYVLCSEACRSVISKLATGTSKSMKNIAKEDFLNIPIVIPPIYRQHEIANTLTIWDHAIDLTMQLIVVNQRRKGGLVQLLMTGQRRFSEFHQPWHVTKISNCLTESRVPGSDGRTARKITVRLYGRGVVPKEERAIGSQATKYYRRSAGQFIYSKLDFLNGAFGIIPTEMDGYESTLDLPCFDFKDTVVPEFFLYFVSREPFYSRFAGAAVGGRKARRIQVDEFLAAEVRIPELAEQRHIADLLARCDRELTLLEQKLALLKQQRQGLMQELLTGKVRVPV